MAQRDAVEAAVTLRRSDLIRANLRSLLRPTFLLIQFGLVNALLFTATILLSPDGTALLADPYVWQVALAVNVLLAASLTAHTIATSLRIWKATPTLQHPTRYRLDHEGVSWTNPLSTGSAPWGALDRVEESRDAFLLYTGKHAVLILPHRSFEEGCVPEARRVLRKALGKGAKLGRDAGKP